MKTGTLLGALALGLGVAAAALTAGPAHAATAPPATTLGIWNGTPGSVPDQQKPDVLNDYVYTTSGFPAAFANQAHAAGATPYIELETWTGGGTSDCAQLHKPDSYYDAIGAAIKAFGHPVIVTWDHEMNIGGQYPWSSGNGCGFTATDWVNGWKQVVTDIRATAGGNAYMMWVPNVDPNGNTVQAAKYWPGSGFVDMTGVDGYPSFCECGGTFADIYGGTFTEIKALPGFTTLPQTKIFLAETDLAPLGSGQYEPIPSFISDMCKAGGDGILQFQDGTPALTAAQWTATTSALSANCAAGASPVPSVTPTSTATTPAPTPTVSTPAPTPTAPRHHRRWLTGSWYSASDRNSCVHV